MPTVCASVPMQAPTTTSGRRSVRLIVALISLGPSNGYSRSITTTSCGSTRWRTGP